jgi:glycosyltransferase involved in cell wall biosynthesis
MLPKKESLEIVVPVYNEESCLDEMVGRLLRLREALPDTETRFIFVNDGSQDRSAEILNRYAESQAFIQVLHLSRNFGHQAAVTAGLDTADADYVAIIDADLQDPPELLAEMLARARQGFDVVYGKRQERKGESWAKKLTAKLFYRLLSGLCDIEIPADTGDFRLISRKLLVVLKQMREKHRFIRGMVPWAGFRSTPFLYDRDKRYAGETKYPLKKMVKFALDAIFSFSNVPLRFATYLGLGIVGLGVLGGIIILYLRLFTTLSVPGISAVILTVIIMGGFQIIMLGIIGEYIGRIFEESKKRPLYVIADRRNIAGEKREAHG